MRNDKNQISFPRVILSVVAVAGLLAMAAVAPNAVQLIAKTPGFKTRREYNKNYYVNKTVEKLISRGLIERVKQYDGIFIRLTPDGERELLNAKLRKEVDQKKLDKWDGKWRMVIFDIKEERKKLREKIRNELIQFGFERLQNSVWVTPHDCEELIMLLKADFSIGKDVLYLLVDKIENDFWLRKKFDIET